jgi:protein-glutamine gamma-glutamyltransferase
MHGRRKRLGARFTAMTLVVIAVCFLWPFIRFGVSAFSPADYLGPARFYRLSWHGQAVGQQQESLRQLPTGEWALELELKVAATVRNAPLAYREHEQLLFAAEAPYRLLRGSWRREQNGALARLEFHNETDRLRGERWLGEQHSHITQDAMAFTLADYYAVSEFVRADPDSAAVSSFKRFNSEQLQLLSDEVTVLERGSRWFGQPWRLAWKRAGERWQAEWLVNADGLSMAMNIGDAVRLELAEAGTSETSQDLYLGRTIHADRAVGTARNVVVMELRWPQHVSLPLTDSPAQTVLPGFVRTDVRQQGLLAPLLEWQAALAVEARYSPEDARMQRLALQLVNGARDEQDKVSRLLHFVSQHLQQQDVLSEQDAAAILRSRRGDCTEFSQLFVALARAASIPAREVSGLVYLGDEIQGFGGHSWAEVVVDGRWLAVDPMWNLLPVSGTHLRMGSGDEGALATAMAQRDLQFSVAQISYR